MSGPLPPGWEEQYAPSGWPYYFNRYTRTATLSDPRIRDYIPTYGSPANVPPPPELKALRARLPKPTNALYPSLISSIFTAFVGDSSSSKTLRGHLSQYLQDQLNPDLRNLLTPRQREHFDTLLRKIMDENLQSILNTELRATLDKELENIRKEKRGSLSTRERLDRIPLVLYIPAPPEDDLGSPTFTAPSDGRWEDQWEPQDLPFIELEEHRAGCMVCMIDFEAPKKKKRGSMATDDFDDLLEEVDDMALNDPEPLRLLPCRHIFHKDCLDPYILNDTEKCPYCRTPLQF